MKDKTVQDGVEVVSKDCDKSEDGEVRSRPCERPEATGQVTSWSTHCMSGITLCFKVE